MIYKNITDHSSYLKKMHFLLRPLTKPFYFSIIVTIAMTFGCKIAFSRPSGRGSFIRAPVCGILPSRAELREVSAARYSFCLNQNHDSQDSRIFKIYNAENEKQHDVGAYGIRPVSNRIYPMYNFVSPPPPPPLRHAINTEKKKAHDG
jgi:hypothetical protein